MFILGGMKSYNTLGGSVLYSPVGDLLTVRLGEYGSAIEEIHVTGCLKSAVRKPRRTLESLFDEFHEYLERLPRITFRRQLKRVEIEFLSEHFTAEDDKRGNYSATRCNLAAQEVAVALTLLRKRIKSSDDFDTDRFLADATGVLSKSIDTKQEWDRIRKAAKEKRRAIQATKSPWELLDVDWEKFHPKARDVLGDPFFWESANDLAPNGNDTGADLLEDYRRWDKRHPRTSPLEFLDGLMAGWDIEPVEWLVTDKKTVKRLEREQPIPLSVCNEAAIGLAFAVIKMRATCPPDVAELGLAALTRTAILVEDSTLSDDLEVQWDVAIDKMRKKLESLQPERSHRRTPSTPLVDG